MRNRAPYLLATDVDGTLLTRDYRLLPDVRDAIQYARSRGIATMLATARGPAALAIVLRDLGEVDYAICFGGAMVLERAAGRWEAALSGTVVVPDSNVVDVAVIARTLGLPLAAYTATQTHIGISNPAFELELEHTGEPVLVTDFASINEPVFKLLAISDRDRTDDLETLRNRLPETLVSVYSHPNYLEITARGVSKGAALADFCAARGIDRNQVVAAGDSDNDVSMFAAAGHSAAMPDASHAARSAADWCVAEETPAPLAAVIRHYATALWGISPLPQDYHTQPMGEPLHAS